MGPMNWHRVHYHSIGYCNNILHSIMSAAWLALFVVCSSQFGHGLTSTTISPEVGESTVMTEIETVQYCSRSKVTTIVEEVDYAWSIDGIFRFAQVTDTMEDRRRRKVHRLAINGLELGNLPGIWGFDLQSDYGDNYLMLRMNCTVEGADNFVINGSVLMNYNSATYDLGRGRIESSILYSPNRYYSGDFGGPRQTLYQMLWRIPTSWFRSILALAPADSPNFTDRVLWTFRINATHFETSFPLEISSHCDAPSYNSYLDVQPAALLTSGMDRRIYGN